MTQLMQVDFLCPKCGSRGYVKDGATTITAAAEVGEQERDLWKVKHIKAIEATTIERCAQVARDFYNKVNKSEKSAFGNALYHTIMALKDET